MAHISSLETEALTEVTTEQNVQTIKINIPRPIPKLRDLFLNLLVEALEEEPIQNRAVCIKEFRFSEDLEFRCYQKIIKSELLLALHGRNAFGRRVLITQSVLAVFKEVKALCSLQAAGQEHPIYQPHLFSLYFNSVIDEILTEKDRHLRIHAYQRITQEYSEDDPIQSMIRRLWEGLILDQEDLDCFCANQLFLVRLSISSQFKMGGEGAQVLTRSLEHNRTLMKLTLAENPIGDIGAIALALFLAQDTALTYLYLSNCKIGIEGAKALAEALMQNSRLTSLDLGDNLIRDDGATTFAESLAKNATLTHLSLWGNRIRDKGAKVLAESLTQNTTLTSLDLGYNRIGDVGAIVFAGALMQNSALLSLDLGGNLIEDDSVKVFAEALMQNSTLTSLDLRDNLVGDEGAKALAESLTQNRALTSFNLSSNEIEDEGIEAFVNTLTFNKTLVRFELSHNQIRNKGMTALDEIKKLLWQRRAEGAV